MTNQGKKYKNIKAFKDFQLNLHVYADKNLDNNPCLCSRKLLEGCVFVCVCRCKDAVTPPNQTADGFPVDSTVQVNRPWWADPTKQGRLLQQQQQQQEKFSPLLLCLPPYCCSDHYAAIRWSGYSRAPGEYSTFGLQQAIVSAFLRDRLEAGRSTCSLSIPIPL